MRLFDKAKDGGPESPVDGYFIIELKSVFSIVLLKFNKGRREAYHTHAFNAFTWFLSGDLVEEKYDGTLYRYKCSLLPKYTPKENNHRVLALEDSWCLSFRGPWSNTWTEHYDDQITTLTHGRIVIHEGKDT